MIIPSKIKSLYGIVGWNQPTYTAYDIVDSDNLGSTSGLKFDEVSSSVTIKNIKNTQEDPDITDSEFNAYLKRLQEDCILNVCNKIISEQGKESISLNLYPFEKSFDKTIDSNSKFVGFRIQSKVGIDFINNIKQLELCFDGAATFNVYLYNSNLKAPIQTKSVTTTANESVLVDLDWNLMDDTTYVGGVFYLGYFQDDLGSVKAIKRDYELANVQIDNPYFKVDTVSTDFTGTIINVQNIEYEADVFGLNLIMNIYNDYTQLLLRNKQILSEAISLQMAEKVLNIILNSTRTNDTQRIVSENVLQFELYGNDALNIKGVYQRLRDSIKNIKGILFNDNPLMISTLR